MRGRNILLNIGLFVLGSAGGFLAGYLVSKNRYLDMAEKEIASVKKVYEKYFSPSIKIEPAKTTGDSLTTKISSESIPEKPTFPDKGIDHSSKETYTKYAKQYSGFGEDPKIGSVKSSIQTKKVTKTLKITPYIITPEEYNDSDYEVVTLVWYSDKILADTDGNIIHNVNEVIGPEALSTFGRYLDDTVYVRDETKKIDYEIIWDTRKYAAANDLDSLDGSSDDASE